MHSLVVVRTYLKLGALNVLQYRANFVFELLGNVFGVLTAIATFA